MCSNVLCDQIVNKVNNSLHFLLLAEKTYDIAGIEQLSVSLLFVNSSKAIRKEFLGFSSLENLNVIGIITCIISSIEKYSLDMNKLVGLDFDR